MRDEEGCKPAALEYAIRNGTWAGGRAKRYQKGGEDTLARRRVQGGRRQAPPVPHDELPQRQDDGLLHFEPPNRKTILEMLSGLEERMRGVPGADVQVHPRKDGCGTIDVAQGQLPRHRARRGLLLDGEDRALLRPRGDLDLFVKELEPISTGSAVRPSNGVRTETAWSSTSPTRPLDALLSPFVKRDPLRFQDADQFVPTSYFARMHFLIRVSPAATRSPTSTMSDTCLRAARSITLAMFAITATVA